MKEQHVFTQAVNSLFSQILQIVKETDFLLTKNRELLWKKIHQVTFQTDGWGIILHSIPGEIGVSDLVFTSLHHFLAMNSVKEILQFKTNIEPVNDATVYVELTEKEQQVIHYVGGYVIFALHKKYMRLNKDSNVIATAALFFFLFYENHYH